MTAIMQAVTTSRVSSILVLLVDPRACALDSAIHRLLLRARNFVNDSLFLQAREYGGFEMSQFAFVNAEVRSIARPGSNRIVNEDGVTSVKRLVRMSHVADSFIKKEILS